MLANILLHPVLDLEVRVEELMNSQCSLRKRFQIVTVFLCSLNSVGALL